MTPAISRRAALKTMLGAVPVARSAQARKNLNVLFLLADDLGWGDLGCHGNRWMKTPALDKLAREGTLFSQFYVANPVCSPSRTAFMTGHFPARHGIHAHLSTEELNVSRAMPNFLDPKVTTLPRLLKDAGYATGHVGKWHLGRGPGAPLPDAYGFTHYRTTVSNDSYFTEAMKDKWFWSKSTSILADETIKFIEDNRNRPFYANFWALLPHAPLNPTVEQMAPYARFSAGARVDHRTAREIYYASVTDLEHRLGAC